MQVPKVFISYSHDSKEHAERVLSLSDRLRRDGVDSQIDQYELSPPEGWPRWMVNKVEWADFVLLICTEIYNKRFTGEAPAGQGKGVKWEGAILTQKLYEAEGRNIKFIPVVLSAKETEHIPVILRGQTYYEVSCYEKLYRCLTNQPKIEKPELGRLKPMPLLNPVQDYEKLTGRQPKYGDIIVKLCNRDPHDVAFREFFKACCKVELYGNVPHFYIIHGDKGQCHGSLIERFRDTHIKDFVNPRWREKTIKPFLIRVGVPACSDLEKHKVMLRYAMFDVITRRTYKGKDYSSQALCSLAALQNYNIVIIAHYIEASEWRPHYRELLQWYITEFWSSIPCDKPSCGKSVCDMRQFLVFLNVMYSPSVNKGNLFVRIFDRTPRIKARVRKELEYVYKSVKDKVPCLLIDELESVTEADVEKWFWDHTEVDQVSIEGYVRNIFEGKKSLNMAEVEKKLSPVFNKIRDGLIKKPEQATSLLS